jgi:hypothetical protein
MKQQEQEIIKFIVRSSIYPVEREIAEMARPIPSGLAFEYWQLSSVHKLLTQLSVTFGEPGQEEVHTKRNMRVASYDHWETRIVLGHISHSMSRSLLY